MGISVHRLEFIVTNACTGRCKHCSNGEPSSLMPGHIEYARLRGQIMALAKAHPIGSLMCFGGEPLLYPDETLALYEEAADAGIPRLQLITNGCFSTKDEVVAAVGKRVGRSPINDVLVSVDAFHQETLPLARVRVFLEHVLAQGNVHVRISPAWLVSPTDCNVYNEKTRLILESLSDLGLETGQGNVIFAAGRATSSLRQYLAPTLFDPAFCCGNAPYSAPLDQADSLSIEPDGGVTVCGFTIGNAYETSLVDIAATYDPAADPAMRAMCTGGISGLIAHAATCGVPCPDTVDKTACDVCRELARALQNK